MNPVQQLALQVDAFRIVETRLRTHKEADERCITDLRQLLSKALDIAPAAPAGEERP